MQGKLHTSVPNFVKNGSINHTMRSIVVATDAEMKKFKQTPSTNKISTTDVRHKSIENSPHFPLLRSTGYETSEIRELIPQYPYMLNRMMKDSVESRIHQKRSKFSLIDEISKMRHNLFKDK